MTRLRTKWIYKNVDELIHNACFAEDVDSFEQAAFEFVDFMFGPVCDLTPVISSVLTEIPIARRSGSGRRCAYHQYVVFSKN